MLEAPATSTAALPRAALPRLGFLGAGWIGRSRLEAVARSGLAEIVAVADTMPAQAEKTVREFAPAAAALSSLEELLALGLDGIVIATPNAFHAAQAVAALRHGCAVFCQKPLACTGAETARVLAAARAADRLLGVDLSYRCTAGMRRIRELVRAGTLGHVYAAELVFHNAYGPDKPWFYDARLAGGGCLLDLGTHLVDLALWCLDFPAVAGVAGHLVDRARFAGGPPTGIDDYASGLLTLDTGACINFACSWKAPAGCDARIELVLFGTAGGASFRNLDGSFYHFLAEHLLPDRTRRILAGPPENWGAAATLEWVQRLAVSRRFDPAIDHVQQVAETLDRLYATRHP